jgi:hypothetical protein
MAQYSLLLSKKGTILSFSVKDPDPNKFSVRKLTGRHFSSLIGADCKKDLRNIIQQISKTRKPGNFTTFLSAEGTYEGPAVEWTIQPKSGSLLTQLLPSRYLLIGRIPE